MISEVMGNVCGGIEDGLVDFQKIGMGIDSFHDLRSRF